MSTEFDGWVWKLLRDCVPGERVGVRFQGVAEPCTIVRVADDPDYTVIRPDSGMQFRHHGDEYVLVAATCEGGE